MDLAVPILILAGVGCVALGWVIGQLIFAFLPEDRFDIWDDDDW